MKKMIRGVVSGLIVSLWFLWLVSAPSAMADPAPLGSDTGATTPTVTADPMDPGSEMGSPAPLGAPAPFGFPAPMAAPVPVPIPAPLAAKGAELKESLTNKSGGGSKLGGIFKGKKGGKGAKKAGKKRN